MGKKFSLATASKRQLYQALARQRQEKLHSVSGVRVINEVVSETTVHAPHSGPVVIRPPDPRVAGHRIVVGKSYGMTSFNNQPIEVD